MTVQTMTIGAAMILAVLVLAPLIIAILPSRQHDPQMGVGVGCLMMVSLAMLIPSALLAWGHFGGHPKLVKVIFWALVAVVGYIAIMGTAMWIVRWRR